MRKPIARRTVLQNGALLAGGLAGAGIVSGGTVAATNTQTFVEPYDMVLPTASNPCIGEDVHITGEIRGNVQGDPSTGHFRFQVHVTGSGAGLTTGTEYRLNISFVDIHPKGMDTLTHRQSTRLISQGGDSNFHFDLLFHITTNANGEVTAITLEPESLKCVG